MRGHRDEGLPGRTLTDGHDLQAFGKAILVSLKEIVLIKPAKLGYTYFANSASAGWFC